MQIKEHKSTEKVLNVIIKIIGFICPKVRATIHFCGNLRMILLLYKIEL